MKFKQFLDENSAFKGLKIIKKKWNLVDNVSTNKDYTIEINDSESHSIIERIKDRTDIKLNNMNTKLQAGIDLILKKANKNFFKKEINFIELLYKESNFKAIFMIKPKNKYLRISSIFEAGWSTQNALNWDINEFFEFNPELSNRLVLNESIHFTTLADDMFCVEINEKRNSYDVYLSDPNDLFEIEINL